MPSRVDEIQWSRDDHERPNKVRVVGGKQDIAYWQKQVSELQEEVGELRGEVNELLNHENQTIEALQEEVGELRGEVDELLNHENKTIEALQEKYNHSWRELQTAKDKIHTFDAKLKTIRKAHADELNEKNKKLSEYKKPKKESYAQTESLEPSMVHLDSANMEKTVDSVYIRMKIKKSILPESTPVAVTPAGSSDLDSSELSALTPVSELGMSDRELSDGPATTNQLGLCTFRLLFSAPEWFISAFSYLDDVSLGFKYSRLLCEWANTEVATGWKGSGMMAKHRPREIEVWRVRKGVVDRYKSGKEPVLAEVPAVDAFGESVWQWWSAMQPAWRPMQDGRPLPNPQFGAKWDNLNRWGPNGWVLLLVTMKWWGQGILRLDTPNRPARLDDWETALMDMLIMLKGVSQFRVDNING
ncbi:SERTA domain-containing protein 3 [Paramarasmius palmivorus]|uniref:SERTA domain-containing protein 3 n=1 Tax=Paramarasmius palmivorus TaxID=297713 RepID=A0AAW0B3K7_9AGAR